MTDVYLLYVCTESGIEELGKAAHGNLHNPAVAVFAEPAGSLAALQLQRPGWTKACSYCASS